MSLYHRVFGVERDALGWEQIEALVAGQALESDWLDYKSKLPADQKGYRKAARSVCAFANAAGGLIVYGIKDVDDAACSLTPVELGEGADSLLKGVGCYLHPPVRGLRALPVASPRSIGQGSLVLEVPASFDRPHAVEEGKKALGFWRRVGRHRVALSEAEVEREYRARGEVREEMRAGLVRIHEVARRSLAGAGESQRPFLVLAASPLHFHGSCYHLPADGLARLGEARAKGSGACWGQRNKYGREFRLRLGAVEGGNWAEGEDGADDENVGYWWCRVERSGSMALGFSAWPASNWESSLRPLKYEFTPFSIEAGVVDSLLAMRHLAAVFGIYPSSVSVSGEITSAARLTVPQAFERHAYAPYEAATVRTEVDLAHDQDLLRCAREVSLEVCSAFGVTLGSSLVRETSLGLALDPAWGKPEVVGPWAKRTGLPVLETAEQRG